MIHIIHKIRLFDVKDIAAFKDWVVKTDYVTCYQLPSVKMFSVHQVSNAADAPFHFYEVIHLHSKEGFDLDMKTSQFQSLVARFSEMAEVFEELDGELVGCGYSDDQSLIEEVNQHAELV